MFEDDDNFIIEYEENVLDNINPPNAEALKEE